MTTELVAIKNNLPALDVNREFVTVYVEGQLFGIPVLNVQDVLSPQRIANIPLAPPQVAGLLNLRGRIVTAIDIRARLHMAEVTNRVSAMNIVVEYKNELYSLLVDSVGDVLSLPLDKFEKNPANLERDLREVAVGVYRLSSQLMVVLDVEKLLTF